MKHDWEYKKLGEVCDVSAGQGAPQGEQSYCEKGTPFIKAGNLEDLVNGLDEGSVQNVSQSIAQKHKLKLYKAGSVLFAKSGMSCMKGYVHVLQRDCYVVSHLAILTPQTIDGHFLKYYLRFTKTYSLVKDEAYPSISLSDIASFPVPVPPLPTQCAIVAELDTLNEILDKKRQQLKELDTLAQSIFYDMFGDPVENEKGWEVKRLGEVCTVTSSKRVYQTEWKNYGIPFLRISDFTQLIEDTTIDTELFISMEKYKELNVLGQVPKSGDILVTSRGTLGNCYIINDNDRFYFQDGMITWLKDINKQIHPLLIKFLFKNNSFRKQIDKSRNGSTVAYLSISMLKKFRIPLPPLFLQQSFARKVEAIEKQKNLINASIKEVETLLNARMGYYFGE